MSNQSDLYAKAMAAMEANGQAPANRGPSGDDVVDYLTRRYGQLIPELNALRSRVWQLENVNHLMRRQELCNVVEQLRKQVQDLKSDVEDREKRIKAMAPAEQFEVIGVYTARTKGVERELRRTLSHLAVASFDGKTCITVDLRGNGRKRANSGS